MQCVRLAHYSAAVPATVSGERDTQVGSQEPTTTGRYRLRPENPGRCVSVFTREPGDRPARVALAWLTGLAWRETISSERRMCGWGRTGAFRRAPMRPSAGAC